MTVSLGASNSTSTSVPYKEIVLIEDNLDGSTQPTIRGTGVIIGPHTILTAAHVVWDSGTGSTATSILAFPGYNGSSDPIYSTAAVSGAWRLHYNAIDDSSDPPQKSQSQSDFAVIDFATTFTSWFGLGTNFGRGTVKVDGYPVFTSVFSAVFGSINWAQDDRSGVVGPDPAASVLDGVSLSVLPGDSGGPLWYNAGSAAKPQNTVVGLASVGGFFSQGYSVQLTPGDVNQINSWVNSDAALWSNPSGTAAAVAPTATDDLDFDPVYYIQHNQDIGQAVKAGRVTDPSAHFFSHGWQEGRNPDQLFNTAWYLANNPDVAAAGLDPVVHFATTGWREGRDPSALFSIARYDALNPDVAAAGIDPLHHYLNTGAREGRQFA